MGKHQVFRLGMGHKKAICCHGVGDEKEDVGRLLMENMAKPTMCNVVVVEERRAVIGVGSGFGDHVDDAVARSGPLPAVKRPVAI